MGNDKHDGVEIFDPTDKPAKSASSVCPNDVPICASGA
jgi:hypothetical protein